MAGTTIHDLRLVRVVDGDTVRVQIDGEEESLRLACLDTEESWPGGSKPVTNAGQLATQWAKDYFGVNDEGEAEDDIRVDIEFDTTDPVAISLQRHRGNFGRLLCYIYKGGENYNLRVVEVGLSPYFVKYGRSRLYHAEFLEAEVNAQAQGIGIWDPEVNSGGPRRDYETLIPWWYLRDSVVQDFRARGAQSPVLSVRLDYGAIVAAAERGRQIAVFCDLQGGINRWPSDGALVYAGSPTHRFNLWIPDRFSSDAQAMLRLIQTRYAGQGRGYVYVSGNASLYPPTAGGTPQIVLNEFGQLADRPPGL